MFSYANIPNNIHTQDELCGRLLLHLIPILFHEGSREVDGGRIVLPESTDVALDGFGGSRLQHFVHLNGRKIDEQTVKS